MTDEEKMKTSDLVQYLQEWPDECHQEAARRLSVYANLVERGDHMKGIIDGRD